MLALIFWWNSEYLVLGKKVLESAILFHYLQFVEWLIAIAKERKKISFSYKG